MIAIEWIDRQIVDLLMEDGRMTEFDCVSYVGCSTGARELSIQVVGRDNQEVYSFVTDTVAKVPGVRKTTTLIVPVILKDVYQWHIPASACRPARPADRSRTAER